mmetsp:Transcript_30138/g.61169  ORF Transcript_30138/g.61169 Transcript_30138/m.61169 type:complete len:95 (-) Transcript_30138:226-510(-)|eukprot:CAMPEP_0178709298 /NCGR_PEP_ID=MMETSP0699-20121125/17144_1 /TAXON_ID=265572 /ORGANISM="Extubocellulus spinifer, Strain CCMP396" /LENGTH=94 /DNA_ID=CAMNT_0020357713 /DNA_START=146 /DNA_END=430 /DNA_ORIENTATION=+
MYVYNTLNFDSYPISKQAAEEEKAKLEAMAKEEADRLEAEVKAKAEAAAKEAEEAKKAAEAKAEEVVSPRSAAVDPIEDKAQSDSAFTCGCIVC